MVFTRDQDVADDLERKVRSETFFGGLRRKTRDVAAGVALTMLTSLPIGFLGPKQVFADEEETPIVEYVVPAASSSGVGGSNWQTHVKAYNHLRPEDPDNQEATILIEAIKNNQSEPVASKEFYLQPGRSMNLEDVARRELGLDKFSGMFRITAPEDVPLMTRTENKVDSSTVGMVVEPQRTGAIPAGTMAVTMLHPEFENYRFNRWITSQEANTITITYRSLERAFHDDGVIATQTVELAPGQTVQANDFITPLFEDQDGNLRTVDWGERPVAMLAEGTAPFNMGVSMTDNRGAQDPTWFTPWTEYKRIVDNVAVDSKGANNSDWNTSMTIWSPWPERHRLDFWFFPEGGGVYTAFSSVAALEGMHYEDIFELFREQNPDFPTGNLKGKLESSLCNQGSYFKVRVFNQNEDGSTSGMGMDPRTRGETVYHHGSGVLYGIASSPEIRTNIGVFEANGTGIDIFRMTIVDGDTGERLWTKQYRLENNEWMQFNDLLAREFGGNPIYQGENAIVHVQPLVGSLHVYATEIPNEQSLPDEEKNNDPSFQEAAMVKWPFDPIDIWVESDKTEVEVGEKVGFFMLSRHMRQFLCHVDRVIMDFDSDGDYEGPDDRIWNYEHIQGALEEFDVTIGPQYEGQTLTPTFIVEGSYNDPVAYPYTSRPTDTATTSLEIHVEDGDDPPTAEQLIAVYWPDRAYLNNRESRSLIQQYAPQLAQIFERATNNTGTPASEIEDWLIMMADGELNAVGDDLYSGFDPIQIHPEGLRFYTEPDGSHVSDMDLTPEDVAELDYLITNTFLPGEINTNPHLYSCNGTTTLDWDCDPTWSTQDPN